MMQVFKKFTARFRNEEEGSASIEFVLYFSVFFMVLTAAVEIAYINLRHSMLERAVDIATREIRLSTGEVPDYATIKTTICDEATILDDCEGNLRLEMVQVDPRDTSTVPVDADCQNAAAEPHPVRSFVPGQDNDLMLLRACLSYTPMMPTAGVGTQLSYDTEGYARMIVTAAFVQEPR